MKEFNFERAIVRIHGEYDREKLKEVAETYIKQVEQIKKRSESDWKQKK